MVDSKLLEDFSSAYERTVVDMRPDMERHVESKYGVSYGIFVDDLYGKVLQAFEDNQVTLDSLESFILNEIYKEDFETVFSGMGIKWD
ncbi:hypothetical protein GOV11_04060 [Candidatus Woesearchaeota archaeon]|nr:hypothetical protein [Candidatus Woesearchaeota archaeon]